MDGLGRLPAVCSRVNDAFRSIGDITSGKDAWSAGGQRHRVDQETAPGSDANARPFGQEGGIWSFADGDQYNVHRQVELGAQHRHRLAPSLFVGLTEHHALAAYPL